MNFPAEGTEVKIVIDNSFTRGTMAPCSTFRAPPTITLRGTVIAVPKWMKAVADYAIFNSATKIPNYIAAHQIITVSGQKLTRAAEVADRVLQVKSSKTGEMYTVRMDGRTRKWSCTCTGFQYHKRCRHVARASESVD